ncbi:hypothetical protein CCYN2B_250093 [Capnocytophaga cynodegmi]|uniref:Uncharacterized protein n=1 Tax=Capnocytophaga cynodegmi TaxID=28189 RepID=A0A0B7HCN7_9FLAO|nr:hypothetical protein CCYN2B_250093 [Capnocytophaga cynodegmi]
MGVFSVFFIKGKMNMMMAIIRIKAVPRNAKAVYFFKNE